MKITRALLIFKMNSKVEMFFISENLKKRKFRKKSITLIIIIKLLNILTFLPKLLRANLAYLLTFCT